MNSNKKVLEPHSVSVTPKTGYMIHYCTVWHELSHTSHFAQAGENYWGGYVNYAVLNGGYGVERTYDRDETVCGLGEAWAYANERFMYYDKFGCHSKSGQSWWFGKYGYIDYIYELISEERQEPILTRSDIFNCLDTEVRSIDDLNSAILSRYPDHAAEILNTYKTYVR